MDNDRTLEDRSGQTWDDEDDYGGCNTCGGQGFVVVCIDDMCRGAGECMHGDGEAPCPECGGDV